MIFIYYQGHFERGRGSELMKDGYHAGWMHLAFRVTGGWQKELSLMR